MSGEMACTFAFASTRMFTERPEAGVVRPASEGIELSNRTHVPSHGSARVFIDRLLCIVEWERESGPAATVKQEMRIFWKLGKSWVRVRSREILGCHESFRVTACERAEGAISADMRERDMLSG